MSLRTATIRLALHRPELRPHLLPLLVKHAAEGEGEEGSEGDSKKKGPPPGWDAFLKEKYDGGKKKVKNPNPKTKDAHPEVSASTALKDKGFRKSVMQEYSKWRKNNPDEDGGKKEDAPRAVAVREDGTPKKTPHETIAETNRQTETYLDYMLGKDAPEEKRDAALIEILEGSVQSHDAYNRDDEWRPQMLKRRGWTEDEWAEYGKLTKAELEKVKKRQEGRKKGKTASPRAASLRTATIRLAYENPSLRSHLLPLLTKQGAVPSWAKGKKFKHPDTGNEVAFGSLPAEQQKKMRAEMREKEQKRKNQAGPPNLKMKVKKNEALAKGLEPWAKEMEDAGHSVPHLKKLLGALNGKTDGNTDTDAVNAAYHELKKYHDDIESEYGPWPKPAMPKDVEKKLGAIREVNRKVLYLSAEVGEKWADNLEKRKQQRKEKKEKA